MTVFERRSRWTPCVPNAVPTVSQKPPLKLIFSKVTLVMRFERIDACWLCPRIDGGPKPGIAARRPEGSGLREGVRREGVGCAARSAGADGCRGLCQAGRRDRGVEARSPGAVDEAARRDDRGSR